MKRIFNSKGLSLIELIVALAIFGMITMVAYPMLNFTFNTSSTQLNETNQRNETRVVFTYLKNDIEYSKDIDVSETTLHITNSQGASIDYYLENSNGFNYLVRKNDSIISKFKDISSVEFEKYNNHLIRAKLITDLENNKFTEFKIYRWESIIDIPEEEEPLYEYIIANKIFILGNQVSISGSSTIDGPEATVIIKYNLNLTGSNIQFITTKNIYVDGIAAEGTSSLAGGAGIGKADNSSSIYIADDFSISGNGRLYGTATIDGNLNVSNAKLSGIIYVNGDYSIIGGNYYEYKNMPVHVYYTGALNKPGYYGNIAATKVSDIADFEFPDIAIPPLKPDSWYAERGYTSNSTPRSNMKYYGDNFSFKNNNGNSFDNVIIASKGDINLTGDKHASGILFAPEGEVVIGGGSTFNGLIFAKKVTVSGNSHVTFDPAYTTSFPF